MRLVLLFIAIVLFSAFSLKNTNSNECKYIIFTSDSLGVFGELLNGEIKTYLYPNKPYIVQTGQRVMFDREHQSKSNRFNITAEVGKHDFFSPDNFYHYRLTNDYLIIIK
jgi:hypothetical protein